MYAMFMTDIVKKRNHIIFDCYRSSLPMNFSDKFGNIKFELRLCVDYFYQSQINLAQTIQNSNDSALQI